MNWFNCRFNIYRNKREIVDVQNILLPHNISYTEVSYDISKYFRCSQMEVCETSSWPNNNGEKLQIAHGNDKIRKRNRILQTFLLKWPLKMCPRHSAGFRKCANHHSFYKTYRKKKKTGLWIETKLPGFTVWLKVLLKLMNESWWQGRKMKWLF